jgi:hypothetical protein
MKIKTISNEEWDARFIKPFIFIGFHEYKMGIVVVVVGDGSVCECRMIEDSHAARQEAFAAIHRRYHSAPLAIFNRKTESYLVDILARKSTAKTPLNLILKGPTLKIKQWQKELVSFLEKGGSAKISDDNPIQLSLLWD